MGIEELKRMAARRVPADGRELRTVRSAPAEIRASEDGEGEVLHGHASVFNEETVIWGMFREVIEPGAFRKTIKRGDIRHLYNHNPDIVLGRTKSKTLRLKEDETGLAFEVDINPEDPDTRGIVARVRRGDVDQSSFAMVVRKEKWEDGTDADEDGKNMNLPLRRIQEVDLYDTSTVTYPAYEGTDSGMRAMGLGVLSQILGLSEEARGLILRSLESGKLPDELKRVTDEFRAAIDRTGLNELDPDDFVDDDDNTSEAEEAEDDNTGDDAADPATDEPAADEAEPESTDEGEPEAAADPAPESTQTTEEAERKRVMAVHAVRTRRYGASN